MGLPTLRTAKQSRTYIILYTVGFILATVQTGFIIWEIRKIGGQAK